MAGNAPPADAPNLEALARARFPDLKPAEVKLVRAAPKGEFAFCGPNGDSKDPTNDPSKADEWGPEREIRAALIRWLCVDRQAREPVDPKGIQVLGAKITGSVDLHYVSVPFALTLRSCRLMERANLQRLEVLELDLQGTWARSISADRARVNGNIFLRSGFRAEGEVRLLGAQIGGSLTCVGGTFINPPREGLAASGVALNADGIDVNGYVFLRSGFRAEGEVRLLRARIGGDLACVAGTFKNPPQEGLEASGRALSADGIDVRGAVFLRNGFQANGAVRFPGARIGGNFDCSNATLANPAKAGLAASGVALTADGADVKGDVFLCEDFRAEGEVRLLKSSVRID